MSEKSSQKKEKRRSSSSSSYSSTSSDSRHEKSLKNVEKNKGKEQVIKPLPSVSKMRLDIGYKIQQEELSDSEDSDADNIPMSLDSKIKYSDVLKRDEKDRKQVGYKNHEERSYRSQSTEKKKDRSRSREPKKYSSNNKDVKSDSSPKSSSKFAYPKGTLTKDRSKSRERKSTRSRSRDRQKRSRSQGRKPSRSPNKDRKKDRSRSRDRRREHSKSKERGEKRRERSRSRDKYRKKSRRDSRSPSYKGKSHYSKKDRSKERSSKRSRSRTRSRSRPRRRSRSRSRSFDRAKRLHDKKLNKLCILEKLGIELKLPEGTTPGEGGANASGFSIPSYYNPAGVNPLKYAQQMQKRRLIWGSKKPEEETSNEKKEQVEASKPADSAGPESVWKGTTFSQDQDGKLTAKFKRLMGIKDSGEEQSSSEKNSELIQKQEEMFSSMEKQYEVARVSTHTHRGLGLGFGVHLPR